MTQESNMGKAPTIIYPNEWGLASDMLTVLSPFEEVTRALSKHSASISEVIPLLHGLCSIIRSLHAGEESEDESDQFMAGDDDQDATVGLGQDVAAESRERYKASCFPNNVDVEALKRTLLLRMELCDPVATPARNTEETPATSSTSVLSFLQKKKSAIPMRTHLPSGDVGAYLADGDISLTDNPVKYWSGKLQCWPNLTHFALQHLSCPPTSVQSERVFSTAGNVSTKEEILQWEEGKKWQGSMEKVRNVLKETEKEANSLSKQLTTIKELYSRLEQEKLSLQKKIKTKGVTADQVVGARTLEADREIEELKRRNSELEQQIKMIRQQQALPRDVAMEDITIRNQYLEERLLSLENQLSKEPLSRPSETEAAVKLRVTKVSLEVTNEKLQADLEETNQRLLLAQSKGLEGADDYLRKMKDLESDISKKNSDISELKGQLKEANEKRQSSQNTIIKLTEQVDLLKNVPIEATTDEGLAKEFHSTRLAYKQLRREKAQLLRQIQRFDEQFRTTWTGPGYKELQEQNKAGQNERKKLQVQ
ncbi:Centrosomal protein of 290 kDa [Triplophysa tibetana]|uniref:Centrosomal protein of 290 kDa n=1 Tax=Triplophysa tibetana TaxID=1572043 RepID=A0A5A9N5Z9_9TELE|nr:Centrosomal protein of 290 kDa [Triplophysa tibetana]